VGGGVIFLTHTVHIHLIHELNG